MKFRLKHIKEDKKPELYISNVKMHLGGNEYYKTVRWNKNKLDIFQTLNKEECKLKFYEWLPKNHRKDLIEENPKRYIPGHDFRKEKLLYYKHKQYTIYAIGCILYLD